MYSKHQNDSWHKNIGACSFIHMIVNFLLIDIVIDMKADACNHQHLSFIVAK